MKTSLAAVLSDGDGPLVAGLIGVLVFLAVIAMAAVLLVGGVAERWRGELGGRLTVQLPLTSVSANATAVKAGGTPGAAPNAAMGAVGGETPGETPAAAGLPAAQNAHVQAALVLLRSQPEVARAEPLSQERISSLLQPWVGSAEELQSIPLPVVIEVELRPEDRDRATGLRQRLQVALPDARIEGGPSTLAPALRLMRGIEALAILVVLVLAATLATAVVFATRAGLSRRQDSVEILHMLGADETGLVDALALGALRTALIGGGAGFTAGTLTLLAFGRMAAAGSGVQDDLALPAAGWVMIAVLPLAAAGIAGLTARVAARRALQGMP